MTMKLLNLSIALMGFMSITAYAESIEYKKITPTVKSQNVKSNAPTTKAPLHQTTLLEEDFEKLKMLPSGWRIPGNNAGNISLQDGFLLLDGRSSSMTPTSILLPKDLEKVQNYRIDVDFTLDQALNNTRWGSIIYDVVETQGVIPIQYYQFTIRADAAAKNGTEFGRKQKNGQWNVQAIAPFSENIHPQKIYKATIIVHANRVQHYLNQVLVQDVEVPQSSLKGGIGLSVAGALLKVKKIKISEQSDQLPVVKSNFTQVQEIETGVALAPTIIQKINHPSESMVTKANQVFYHLDQKLNLIDRSGTVVTTLSKYLEEKQRKTIAVLKIQDQMTLEALKQLSQTHDISDITLLSNQSELLNLAHNIVPMVRTAIDLSAMTHLSNSRKDLSWIVQQANQSLSKIVVLPTKLVNKENVSFIQRLLMTVWVDSSTTQIQDVASLLTSGVNGVMTPNSELFIQVLKQFPKNTLLRKPLIIGHRGVPSLEDENTLESAKHAVNLGADIVENDIYITKDNHVVVMHDDTVDRTSNGHGKIEEMTLAQVQQLRTKNKNYKIPTLADYFKAFKNTKNFVLMVEMKSANPQLVPALKEEIKKYGVEDQVVTTSFNRDQIQRAKANISGISRGILVGAMPNSTNPLNNAQQIMWDAQKYTATYNSAYRNDLANLMEATKHRGISFWPWNLDDLAFKKLYLAGTYGITTNATQLYSKYIVDIQAPTDIKVKVGQALNVNTQLRQQDRTELKQQAQQFIILSGSPKHEFKEGVLVFTEKGTAYVLAGYKYQIDQQYSYNIFSKPVKVQVQ